MLYSGFLLLFPSPPSLYIQLKACREVAGVQLCLWYYIVIREQQEELLGKGPVELDQGG